MDLVLYRTRFAAVHHPVAGVVVTDDVLVGVVVLADVRELRHVEATLSQFPHGLFGLGVCLKTGDGRVVGGHYPNPVREMVFLRDRLSPRDREVVARVHCLPMLGLPVSRHCRKQPGGFDYPEMHG